MKKLKIDEIAFINKKIASEIPQVQNMSHYKIVSGGIILTSDKNFNYLKNIKIFIPFRYIKYILT